MTDSIWSFDNPSQTTFPLPGLITNPTAVLQLADPVMYNLATFFTQILNTNLLPRFSDEALACGLTHASLDNWVDGYAVSQTIVFPLNESLLKVADFKFPLLAIQPQEDVYVNYTLAKLGVIRQMKVAWVLPPLTPFQYNRMYPFLQLASKALLAYGNQGYDPKVSDVSFWFQAGLSFGGMEGAKYQPYTGFAKKDEKVYFPTLELDLWFQENNQSPVPQNFIDFSGVYPLQINLYDGYNPANPIDNFVDGYIPPNITLTSCSPNSGSIQGNTLLVIQGTGFDPAKLESPFQLMICGSPAAAVKMQSPTVMMVVTNPGITTGIGDIVFTDLFGIEYTLANGFTYSSP